MPLGSLDCSPVPGDQRVFLSFRCSRVVNRVPATDPRAIDNGTSWGCKFAGLYLLYQCVSGKGVGQTPLRTTPIDSFEGSIQRGGTGWRHHGIKIGLGHNETYLYGFG